MRQLLFLMMLTAYLTGADAAGYTRDQVESGAFLALAGDREPLRTDERVEVAVIDDGALLAVLLPERHGGTGGRPVVILHLSKTTQRYVIVMDTAAPVYVTHEEGNTQVFGYWHYSSRDGKIDGLRMNEAHSLVHAGELPVVVSPDTAVGNLMFDAIKKKADSVLFLKNPKP